MVRREEIQVMQDAWRSYLDLALGVTETSRKKATKVVRKLVGRGNATAEQLQSMAEELVSTSRANREALSRLVRFELERGLTRVGLATADEVDALTARVKELEKELEETKNGRVAPAASVPAAIPVPAAAPAPAKKAVAKKAVAKKAVAKTAVAKKTVAKKVAEPVVVVEPAAPETPVVTAPLTPAPRQAPVAKKAAAGPAKKAVAKRAPAKKAVGTP
jgi:polyhydroxyalkanoate synthesis regulator phasin